jgi:hypothetical protein
VTALDQDVLRLIFMQLRQVWYAAIHMLFNATHLKRFANQRGNAMVAAHMQVRDICSVAQVSTVWRRVVSESPELYNMPLHPTSVTTMSSELSPRC